MEKNNNLKKRSALNNKNKRSFMDLRRSINSSFENSKEEIFTKSKVNQDVSFNKTINSENLSKEFFRNELILNDISKISYIKPENRINTKNSDSENNSALLRSLSLDNSELSENSEYSDYLDHLNTEKSNQLSSKKSLNEFQIKENNSHSNLGNFSFNLGINKINANKNSFRILPEKNEDEEYSNKNFKENNSFDLNLFLHFENKNRIPTEDTQMSFFSDLSIDNNLQNSFVKHFGSSKFHEKFFKQRKKKKIFSIECPNELISLKMFRNGFLQSIEKSFWIYKTGLKDSCKNTYANEIVIGRFGKHFNNKKLVIHDIPLSKTNKSVSRLHCFLDTYYNFKGTFKITKPFISLLFVFKSKKGMIDSNIIYKIVEFIKKPKKTILYDLNSTTGTLIKLKNSSFPKSLTPGLKFYLGEDANFKVDSIQNDISLKSLKQKFRNSLWRGFDNIDEILDPNKSFKLNNILILKVENSSSNLKSFIILNYVPNHIFHLGRAPENEIMVNICDISRNHSM